MIASSDHFWAKEENQFHYAQAIAALIGLFVENHHMYSSVEK